MSVVAALFITLQIPLALFASPLASADSLTSTDTAQVTLCHATHATPNPYEEKTVDAAGAYNGHYNGAGTENGHADDIIPAFTYQGVDYPAQGANQALLDTHCIVPAVPVTLTSVTPAAVTHNEQCGTANDSYTVPTTEGVTYLVNDSAVTVGAHAGSGTVTITAVAQSGYILDAEAIASWTFTFSNESCGDDGPTCINGSMQQNLDVHLPSAGTTTIATAGGAPLCDAVTIYFSSYVMPSNYDGQGFLPNGSPVANPTAYPQTIYDSAHITLPAGYQGLDTLNVGMPNTCNNAQVDVYYALEITVVGPAGHGTQNILSQVYGSTGPCETEEDTPVTLCHATGSESNPYVQITVSAAGAASGHYGNGVDASDNDIIPAFTYNGAEHAAQNFSTINQTIYNNHCVVPASAPVGTTGGGDHVGLGGGSAPVTVLSMLTPPVVAAAATSVAPTNELVNTGSTTLLNMFAGLFIIGAAGALATTPSKRRYS